MSKKRLLERNQKEHVTGREAIRRKRKRTNIAFVILLLLSMTMFAVIFSIVLNAFAYKNEQVDINGLEETVEVEMEEQLYTDKDVELIAKTVWGGALVTNSDTQMSAVVWCILNRVDAEGYACGNSIEYVITFPNQFAGYKKSNPVNPHIEQLVKDVLDRWVAEKQGEENVGRTLPEDYMWFVGDGKVNTFRNDYDYDSADIWDWSLESPYER